MKKLIFCLFFFVTIYSFSQSLNLDWVRTNFAKLNNDSASTANLFQKTKTIISTDNALKCYKGAIEARLAGFSKNNTQKLNLFKEGKKMIEESIATDTNNVELLFLRFTIQSNCPKILGYNQQISNDKKIILENFNQVKNQDVKKHIKTFMLQSSYLTEAEKKKINK